MIAACEEFNRHALNGLAGVVVGDLKEYRRLFVAAERRERIQRHMPERKGLAPVHGNVPERRKRARVVLAFHQRGQCIDAHLEFRIGRLGRIYPHAHRRNGCPGQERVPLPDNYHLLSPHVRLRAEHPLHLPFDAPKFFRQADAEFLARRSDGRRGLRHARQRRIDLQRTQIRDRVAEIRAGRMRAYKCLVCLTRPRRILLPPGKRRPVVGFVTE